MPIAAPARTSVLLCVAAMAGCGAARKQPASAPAHAAPAAAPTHADPCYHGATIEEAHRCLDRAEAIKRSGGDGAPQLAAKVCGGLHDPHDLTRCFNLGVLVH